MEEFLNLVRGPYGIWHVLGALITTSVGIIDYLALRGKILGASQGQGDDGHEAQARQESARNWEKLRLLLLAHVVLLSLAGFFLLGGVFRQYYG